MKRKYLSHGKNWQKRQNKRQKRQNFPINIFNEIIDYSFLPENLIILAFQSVHIFESTQKKQISKLLIVIKNQFKKLKETNFEKNGVFSKILFVKKRKRQKRQKRKKLIKAENFVFFLRFVIVAAPFNFSDWVSVFESVFRCHFVTILIVWKKRFYRRPVTPNR